MLQIKVFSRLGEYSLLHDSVPFETCASASCIMQYGSVLCILGIMVVWLRRLDAAKTNYIKSIV